MRHYLRARDGVVRRMGGLPSIAPKKMREHYRSYIDGLLMVMDNKFCDSFGRTSVPGGRTWSGADPFGGLNQLGVAKAKGALGGRELEAHRDGFAVGYAITTAR